MNQCDECEQGKAANNAVVPLRPLCHEPGNFDGTWHWCELLHPRRSAQVILQPAVELMV
jgi:hypothetical protein